MSDDKDTIIDRIIDLLSDCLQTNLGDEEKVNNLLQVQELVIHNDLLDNFLDEIIGFSTDRSIEVKKFVVGFVEASCTKDADYFNKLLINLNYFLNDSSANVVKKAIQTATKLYKHFLVWLNKTKEDEQTRTAIEVWNQIKQLIIELFDTTENDGIRTQCIKYMEILIILQTRKDKWTVQENEFDLSDIKRTSLVDLEQLEEEARQTFESLVIFHGSPHISSVNLMATMQSLVLICRNRSSYFMAKVIQALEVLHANLPPTLAKSQVSSVRKQLKLQLQILLKHPAAALNPTYQLQIIQLLNDLGATQSDVHKCLQEVRKRGLKIEQAHPEPKRIKLENDSLPKTEADSGATGSSKVSMATEIRPIDSNLLKVSKNDAFTAIDVTAESLVPKLSDIENACDLVLISLLSLPDQMPVHFQASYTPVGTAGTPTQIKHLARLLATQFTGAGIGRGVQDMISKVEHLLGNENLQEEQRQKISSLVSRGIAQEIKKQEILNKKGTNKINLAPASKTVSVTKAMKQLDFAKITTEPSNEFKRQVVIECVHRILNEDDKSQFSNEQIETRVNILSNLAVKYQRKNIEAFNLIKDYAFNELRTRMIILNLIVRKRYESLEDDDKQSNLYNDCLVSITTDFIYKTEPKDRDHYLPKFYAELPNLTDDAISLLKDYIMLGKASTIENGFIIAKTLIENIGSFRFKVLGLILELCTNQNIEIRNLATKNVKQLYEECDEKFREEIERVTFQTLQKMLDPNTPNLDEELIKLNLLPYLNLLPSNHKLIHNLASVYVSMNANLKRVILRSLDSPVKGMGMSSPELLTLVENCPKGAETLVTRIIHVLTEHVPPSIELVSRVRDLYHKRVPDVRFLIPVLNGLSKKEIIDALPELIMLNPNVVKEVFNRLLNDNCNFQSPLTPSELLIALHNIESKKCDMKTIIKATGLCFAEKNIYTPEVLGVVMQKLMEQFPLPTLLMRTVIQSVSLYPQLIGFVMNVLQRLILMQVWKQKKVWEGFIKCCQRTKPKSFQVLLQLPAPQLRTVFASSPDFKTELQHYVESFDSAQRSLIPQTIQDAIFKDDQADNEIKQPKNEQLEPDEDSNSMNVDKVNEESNDKSVEEDSNQSSVDKLSKVIKMETE